MPFRTMVQHWTRDADTTQTPGELQSQWENPSDILSLLLLIGSDVVQRALAQQVGHRRWPTPVPFSFGWVAYGFMALSSAVGENRLLPVPDTPCVVISTKEGYQRTNESWILGRLLRDHESVLMTAETKRRLRDMIKKRSEEIGNKAYKAGLCVSVFSASKKSEAGVPRWDWWFLSGYAVAVVQLVIAAIPWILYGQWEIFVIVLCGNLLAFLTGSLSQWRKERYACRRHTSKNFVLTRGNGAQHAIVILGDGCGLDFEDLASVTENASASMLTRFTIGIFALFWVALLITVSGIKENTWFLIAVGGLGMVHTSIIAGVPRKPSAFGIHLQKEPQVFMNPRVMDTLKNVEREYPGIGLSMLPVFFPGGLRDKEETEWKVLKDEYKKYREAEKMRRTQSVVETPLDPQSAGLRVTE